MEVLLINPPREIPQKVDFPPIGLAYISAVLKKEGIETQVLDASPFSWERLAGVIRQKTPRIVGISCWSMERCQAFETAKLVRKILPNAKIILGGHHATAFPRHIFIRTPADAVVIGEGELTALDLVRTMLTNGNVGEVRGIAYSEAGKVLTTEPRDFITDLDQIPYPSYSDFNLDDYLGMPDTEGRTASIITSRGCPHGCIFCSASQFWKRKWRARSPDNVLGEIEWLYHNQGVRNLTFFDDNFTVNKERAIAICRGIINRSLNINYAASSHVTHIDKELLGWMKNSGCFRIDFGIESGSPKVLRNIEKRQTVGQIEETFRLVHDVGIKPRAYLLVGNPGETVETIEETVSLMKKIRAYDSRTATITMVFPNTKLFELAKANGLLSDDFWLQSDETPLYTCEHTLGELKALRDRLMKGLAENEGTFKATMEYWVRKVYYKYPFLQKMRQFRRVFK